MMQALSAFKAMSYELCIPYLQATVCLVTVTHSQVQWFMPVISALERMRQEDCCKLEASLDYIVSF